MLEVYPPVLKDNLSYQRALGVGVFIATLSGKCNLSISTLYIILSNAIENEKIDFIFTNGRPRSFSVYGKDINSDVIYYEIDNLSLSSKIFSSISLNSNLDFYRVLGNFLELLAFSKLHQEYHAADYFIKSVIPPVSYSFFYLYYNEKEHPYGVISWARVSKTLSRRLENEFLEFSYKDWWSGERLFIYDILAPWGCATEICRHLSKNLFYLDEKAVADRRKSNKVRKAKLLAGRSHKNSLIEKIEALKNSLNALNIKEIELNLSILLNFVKEYELRVLLDKNNKYFTDSLLEIKLKTAPIITESLKHLQLSTNSIDFFNVSINIINESLYNFKLKLNYFDTDSINFSMSPRKVIDIMNSIWGDLIKDLNLLDMENSVLFDLRDTEDKIEKSFCKFMGKHKPIYISMKYDCTLKSALVLSHEYSHAIHFKLTSMKGEFSIENRTVLLEFFSILGEMLFANYLINNEIIPKTCIFSLLESSNFYFKENYEGYIKCQNFNEVNSLYGLSYPISFFLASKVFFEHSHDSSFMDDFLHKLIHKKDNLNYTDFVVPTLE
ncbi:toxin-activating lysine-acyltransferase [Vibrio vulnificus]|uniref:RTX toxin-activating lysine-acyltransferase n=1 Tax=Vibrio vulnificus TaxID=672 RepID=A0AAN1PLM7_VIBVL|nr:toxin-activating lysine-acyltransferase [Vibrio vulnificus]AXX58815.1 hypothetical protein FORC53_0476 [Vibrio vulnificus]